MTTDADGWIKHDGKGMPVAEEVRVALIYADGTTFASDGRGVMAGDWVGWDWSKEDSEDNLITHYRIVDEASGASPGKGDDADIPAAIEALRPFAAIGQYLIDEGFTTKPDSAEMWGFDRHYLTYGDFRRAATAFAMVAERSKK